MPAWTPPAPLRTDVTPETLSDPAHPNLHNATSTAVNTIVSMLGTDPTQAACRLGIERPGFRNKRAFAVTIDAGGADEHAAPEEKGS